MIKNLVFYITTYFSFFIYLLSVHSISEKWKRIKMCFRILLLNFFFKTKTQCEIGRKIPTIIAKNIVQ